MGEIGKRMMAKSYEGSFGGAENLPKLTVMMVALILNVLETVETQCNCVNCMIYVLYLSESALFFLMPQSFKLLLAFS